jgi:hypothetical protein
MRQVYSWVLGVSLALLVLVGSACGGESGEPQEGSSSGGFTSYTVESDDFSVAVPQRWQTASADDVLTEERIDQLRETNPMIADAVESLGKPSSTIKLLAFDPAASKGFATNLNVGVIPLPEGVTEEQFFQVNIEQVTQVMGEAPEQEEVDLPAGHAMHMTWEIAGADVTSVADQYFFYRHGRGYVLTYSTRPDLTEQYASTFERSARSFRFL